MINYSQYFHLKTRIRSLTFYAIISENYENQLPLFEKRGIRKGEKAARAREKTYYVYIEYPESIFSH